MSALGQMVAGIAHEINNPLNFIAGNITHLEGYAEDLMAIASHCDEHDAYGDTVLREQLENVEIEFLLEDLPNIIRSLRSGGKRIKDSVLALRKFSRLDNRIVDTVDLHEGIDSALRVLAHKLEHNIHVKKDYGTLPLVKCYPAQLNQVFRHLLANAADALLDSELDSDCREKVIRIGTGLNNQGLVYVSIEDNGAGIAEDIQRKIFDPFFTTKPVGQGAGLGLAIAYQIMEDHRGFIEVKSDPGQGSTFTVCVPER